MKNSLSSKQINTLLLNASSFKTDSLSFRYLFSSVSGVAFSINKTLGNAVLRNGLKRKSRALIGGPLFRSFSFQVVIHPRDSLSALGSVSDDFKLFSKHLSSAVNKNNN